MTTYFEVKRVTFLQIDDKSSMVITL